MTNKDFSRKAKQPVVFNRPFKEKLGGYFNKNQQNNHSNVLPNLYRIGADGVDHININYDGETDLGHALHQNSKFRFTHDLFGPFLTIEGFFRWLYSENGDDAFRDLDALRCSYLAKKTINRRFVPNLRYLVLDATWQKLNAYPELKEALGESILPLDSYYYYIDNNANVKSATRMRPFNATWMVEGIEVMRDNIKAGTEPNFEHLLDDPDEYDKMVRSVKSSIIPSKIQNILDGKVTKVKQPRQIPNPPGTGKKAKAKARAIERQRLSELLISDMNAFMALPQEGLVKEVLDKHIKSITNLNLDLSESDRSHVKEIADMLLNSDDTNIVEECEKTNQRLFEIGYLTKSILEDQEQTGAKSEDCKESEDLNQENTVLETNYTVAKEIAVMVEPSQLETVVVDNSQTVVPDSKEEEEEVQKPVTVFPAVK